MSATEVGLACEADDAELCRLMAEIPMHGRLSVSFRRDPSYYAGSIVQGFSPSVIIARQGNNHRAIGLGTRLKKNLCINGAERCCGYLCDLRIRPSGRCGFILSRGYRLLSELQRSDPLSLYLTVIYGDNSEALGALVGKRAHLPNYIDLGQIFTPAIYLDASLKEIRLPGIRFCRGTPAQLDQILEFLTSELLRKQFSPVITKADFSSAKLAGLAAHDFYLAFDGRSICGVIAAWDQDRFRQIVVEKYPTLLALGRPLYNLWAQVAHRRVLPACGDRFRYFYAAFIAIKNNDPEIFGGLLRYLYLDRRSGPWSLFILGLHARDPLRSALKAYRAIESSGRLFRVNFEASTNLQIDDRLPYFEMACA